MSRTPTSLFQQFYATLLHSARNLLPIILVVAFFQFAVLQQVPSGIASIALGLGIVVLGVALFLQGLEMGVFPVAKSLSDEFTAKGSLPWLMVFGFFLGFSAVIAEPALIAVAEQAAVISEGRVDPFMLRLLVAGSVGAVVAVGVLRIILGLALHWMMIGGYLVVVIVTFFAPEEIVGLAYDSGGVTTNIVTVPLIAGLGLGLAAAIRGRNPLIDGFGLVALAVMVPMITVQLYGIVVFGFGAPEAAAVAPLTDTETLSAIEEQATTAMPNTLAGLFIDLARMVRDVLPIIAVILVFQFLVIRRRLPHAQMVVFGFLLVIVGLYAFVVGLKLGLFPIGESMAEQLIANDNLAWLYVFAFAIGFVTNGDSARGHAAYAQAQGEISGGGEAQRLGRLRHDHLHGDPAQHRAGRRRRGPYQRLRHRAEAGADGAASAGSPPRGADDAELRRETPDCYGQQRTPGHSHRQRHRRRHPGKDGRTPVVCQRAAWRSRT